MGPMHGQYTRRVLYHSDVPAPRGALVFLVMVRRRRYINRSPSLVDDRAPSDKKRATCTLPQYTDTCQCQEMGNLRGGGAV